MANAVMSKRALLCSAFAAVQVWLTRGPYHLLRSRGVDVQDVVADGRKRRLGECCWSVVQVGWKCCAVLIANVKKQSNQGWCS